MSNRRYQLEAPVGEPIPGNCADFFVARQFARHIAKKEGQTIWIRDNDTGEVLGRTDKYQRWKDGEK